MKVDKIYICIHSKLKEKARGGFMNKKDALFILGCVYHIPKEDRNDIMKKLHDLKMIKQNGRSEIEVMK